MLRRRRAGDDDPARADAILVGLAAAFLTWTFVICPAISSSNLSGYRVLDALFPIVDVVMLILVAQLILAGGVQQAALWLLIVAAAAMFAGDLLFSLRDARLIDISQRPSNALFLLMFVLIPASALHPSTRTLVEPQKIVVRDLSRLRLLVIGLVVVVPTVITSLVPVDHAVSDVVRAGLCALIVLSVLARVVHSNNSRRRSVWPARAAGRTRSS